MKFFFAVPPLLPLNLKGGQNTFTNYFLNCPSCGRSLSDFQVKYRYQLLTRHQQISKIYLTKFFNILLLGIKGTH